MIFATVGTQLPFPRLMEALNGLAPDLDEEIIAQCGQTEGHWPHLEARPSLTPQEFETIFTAARLVVAHAGIGTILSAKRWGKPLVLLPRRHGLGEHRNDHQLATAKQMAELPGIYVAWEAADLPDLLQRRDLVPSSAAQSPSHAALLTRLRQFVADA